MSRVAYGQKGYSGASMSVNARAAYEAGGDAPLEMDQDGDPRRLEGLLR